MPIAPELSLTAPDAAPVGAERIRLLETIGQAGSISAAARSLGMSYKAAWDAVAAMNNLVGRPLVEARPGGRSGGGAVLTPDGTRLIAAFRRLEDEMARSFAAIDADLGGTGLTVNDGSEVKAGFTIGDPYPQHGDNQGLPLVVLVDKVDLGVLPLAIKQVLAVVVEVEAQEVVLVVP